MEMVLNAMAKVIDNCVQLPDGIKAIDLATFDLEYLFVQLRSISVGETTDVRIKCEKCEHENEVTINFKNVKFDKRDSYNLTLVLTPEVKVLLSYPKVTDISKLDMAKAQEGGAESLFEAIRMSIEKVLTKDEQFIFREYSIEEQNAFIDQFNNAQLKAVIEFLNEMPTTSTKVNFKCDSCTHENELTLRGTQSFFS